MIFAHFPPFTTLREFHDMSDQENAKGAMADVARFLEEAAVRLAAAGMESKQHENRKIFFDAQLAVVACERKVRKIVNKV